MCSHDAGLTVENSDEQVNEMMKEAATALHLAQHKVRDIDNVSLYSAADVEGFILN